MTLRYTFKTEPYKHQRKALARIHRLEGKSGVWMPMRTGKTKVAIDWAGIGYYNFDVRRVLIVSPIHVIDVWKDQIEQHCPVPSHVIVLRDSTKQNAATMREAADMTIEDMTGQSGIQWVIVNYEMVWRLLEPIHKDDSAAVKARKRANTLDRTVAAWRPDLVIADEAHKIKAHTSEQSKALARLGRASRMRLALTGTPMTKWPLDAYGIYRFTDPEVFPQTKWRCWKKDPETYKTHEHTAECEGFADHYAEWGPTRFDPRIEEVKRYRNLPELVDRIRRHSYSIRLEDAFPDLPERQPPVDIRITLPPRARRIYNEMAKEAIAEIESQGGKLHTAIGEFPMTKVMRLSQITSGFVKDEEGVEVELHDAKERACMELVNNMLEQDEKVVVFCRFVYDYERVISALRALRIGHATLTGKTPEKQRPVEIKRFRDDPATKVFVAQIQSGSVGIDLSAARLAIFYSLTYNWADYVQACDRILDPRRPRPLGIYRLLVPNSVDMVQRRVLDERADMAETLIHNPRALLEDA